MLEQTIKIKLPTFSVQRLLCKDHSCTQFLTLYSLPSYSIRYLIQGLIEYNTQYPEKALTLFVLQNVLVFLMNDDTAIAVPFSETKHIFINNPAIRPRNLFRFFLQSLGVDSRLQITQWFFVGFWQTCGRGPRRYTKVVYVWNKFF